MVFELDSTNVIFSTPSAMDYTNEEYFLMTIINSIPDELLFCRCDKSGTESRLGMD
jgi:hypothetical protein